MKSKTPEYPINKSKLAKYVAKAQKGDSKAFEKIVQETKNYIYYYCLSILKDEEKALEGVQDIYVILFKKLDSVKNPEAFLGWLKVVSSNYCKNKLARAKNHSTLEEDILSIDDSEYLQITPERCVETDEICDIINSAVDNLPDFQRECVLMHYYYQMSISQIAVTLDIKEGTVKSRLFNARKALKTELEKYGKDSLTFEAVSPMAYITYALLRKSQGAKLTVPINLSSAVSEGAVDSGSVLAYAVATMPVTAKSFAFVKVIAITSAVALATGGVVAHNVLHSDKININSDSVVVIQTDSANTPYLQNIRQTEPATQKPEFPTERTYEIFYANGFTDEFLREDIEFRNEEELNSENNKSYVYDRMRNSLDFINTMQGTYYERMKTNGRFTATYETYCFQLDDIKSKGISFDSYGNPITMETYDGYYAVSANLNSSFDNFANEDYNESVAEKVRSARNNYRTSDIPETSYKSRVINNSNDNELDFVAIVDSRKRKLIVDEEETVFFRKNLACQHMATAQYMPEIFAATYLDDFDKWRIDKIDTSFGRECFNISGSADGQLEVYSFNICVDKENGAVISMTCYDENGDEVRQLITYEYVVNEPLSTDVLKDIDDMKTK